MGTGKHTSCPRQRNTSAAGGLQQSSEVSVSFFYLTQVIRSSCDENKYGGVRIEVLYFGLAGPVMPGCAVAINWNTPSAYAKTLRQGSSTAWYAMPQQAANRMRAIARWSIRRRSTAPGKMPGRCPRRSMRQPSRLLPACGDDHHQANRDEGVQGPEVGAEDSDDDAEVTPFGFRRLAGSATCARIRRCGSSSRS